MAEVTPVGAELAAVEGADQEERQIPGQAMEAAKAACAAAERAARMADEHWSSTGPMQASHHHRCTLTVSLTMPCAAAGKCWNAGAAGTAGCRACSRVLACAFCGGKMLSQSWAAFGLRQADASDVLLCAESHSGHSPEEPASLRAPVIKVDGLICYPC